MATVDMEVAEVVAAVEATAVDVEERVSPGVIQRHYPIVDFRGQRYYSNS